MAPPLIARPVVQRRQFPGGIREVSSAPVPSPTGRPNPTSDGPEAQNSASATPNPSATPSGRRGSPSALPSTMPPQPTSPTPTSSASNSGGINMNSAQSGIVIAIVAIIGIIILSFLTYVILKSLRLRYKDPKYLPGSYLKKKWQNWDVMGYHATPTGSGTTTAAQARINRVARSRANIEANRALDRQNSVRSVITLPPYREMAEMDLERTIGREGERAGLDTIVVFPETADEEETRREERMQAMYELRLQRRAQRAAREARNNGSAASLGNNSANNSSTNVDPNATSVSLTAMDMEAGGSGRTASELTAAILNDRTRRLSEVSYADVGYSRHDGSRIRSTSTNRNSGSNNASADSQPLLSDNASNTGRNRASRPSSIFSLNTNVSGGRGSMDRRDSTELLTGGDIGGTRLPPSYDGLDWGDAPPYMSPISPVGRSDTNTSRRTGAGASGEDEEQRQRPVLNVPLVRVIGASNPGSPMSPQGPNQREGAL
ncbi:hypothetical protein Dda_8615 [Drechslerella dactyloides]|uniref:Uncharacterized protein n=1 Tax=Drechslerella dactyloides TaxID=74499 RepID=A0AAD6NHG7_DREDA|nr:hypothetical protein Dda_8615 [Drechslerella dactyloides]